MDDLITYDKILKISMLTYSSDEYSVLRSSEVESLSIVIFDSSIHVYRLKSGEDKSKPAAACYVGYVDLANYASKRTHAEVLEDLLRPIFYAYDFDFKKFVGEVGDEVAEAIRLPRLKRFSEYNFHNVSSALLEERKCQFSKWGEQNHNPFIWLSILTEEVGEVAQAALHDEFGGKANGTLEEELAQVAAVAIQWLESIRRQRQLNGFNALLDKESKWLFNELYYTAGSTKREQYLEWAHKELLDRLLPMLDLSRLEHDGLEYKGVAGNTPEFLYSNIRMRYKGYKVSISNDIFFEGTTSAMRLTCTSSDGNVKRFDISARVNPYDIVHDMSRLCFAIVDYTNGD